MSNTMWFCSPEEQATQDNAQANRRAYFSPLQQGRSSLDNNNTAYNSNASPAANQERQYVTPPQQQQSFPIHPGYMYVPSQPSAAVGNTPLQYGTNSAGGYMQPPVQQSNQPASHGGGYGYNAVRYAADWLKRMGSNDQAPSYQNAAYSTPQAPPLYSQQQQQQQQPNSGLTPLAAKLRIREKDATPPSRPSLDPSPFLRPHAPTDSMPIMPGLPFTECKASYAGATPYQEQQPQLPQQQKQTHVGVIPATGSTSAVSTPPIEESLSTAAARKRIPPIHLRPGLTPGDALVAMGGMLTPFEKAEVLNYDQVWFVGRVGTEKIRGSVFNGTAPNNGYDDARGELIPKVGDHLKYRYEIMEVLGRGSFGQVLKCWDHATSQPCAVKIIRNKKRFQRQAQVEAKILSVLQAEDPMDTYNIVRMVDHFTFRNHFCLTFELLSINLYERIKAGGYKAASQNTIKRIGLQVLETLCFLRKLGICHCDIKPENILLKEKNGTLIKVIDFGSSCYVDQRVYTYIQSRFYRAPEVILGLPYGPAIDMWSLGCVLAELHTGTPLFPGENEAEQLACVMDYLGVPPRSVLAKAPRYKTFFDQYTGRPHTVPPNSRGATHSVGSKSLEKTLGSQTDYKFIDFVRRCLRYEPELRMTPAEALNHEWLEGPVFGGTSTAAVASGVDTGAQSRRYRP